MFPALSKDMIEIRKKEVLLMDFLHFSENLVRLRREKKLTQEQLADFIGVTKAAISKWETKQSASGSVDPPQIVILLRYFN